MIGLMTQRDIQRCPKTTILIISNKLETAVLLFCIFFFQMIHSIVRIVEPEYQWVYITPILNLTGPSGTTQEEFALSRK